MNLVKLDQLTKEEIYSILHRADVLKEHWNSNSMPQSLMNMRVGLWFFGQGFRNRVAFELGARSMGADVTYIPGELGVHEPIDDVTHYLNNWFSMLIVRCRRYEDLQRVVDDATVPVINARTEFNHPCEILGDLQFVYNRRKSLDNLKVAFFGEVTNLCMSWFEVARVLPIEVVQVAPPEFLVTSQVLGELNHGATGRITTSTSIDASISKETDIIYTDCWPKNIDNTANRFLPYQVNAQVVKKMNPNGFFMPCPPITRGQEVSLDALAADQYCNYEAKEYLLHSQNAIMEFCITKNYA